MHKTISFYFLVQEYSSDWTKERVGGQILGYLCTNFKEIQPHIKTRIPQKEAKRNLHANGPKSSCPGSLGKPLHRLARHSAAFCWILDWAVTIHFLGKEGTCTGAQSLLQVEPCAPPFGLLGELKMACRGSAEDHFLAKHLGCTKIIPLLGRIYKLAKSCKRTVPPTETAPPVPLCRGKRTGTANITAPPSYKNSTNSGRKDSPAHSFEVIIIYGLPKNRATSFE